MNELLLIDMMSELDPVLFEDDYIEKDMKREKIPFYKLIFKFRKTPKQSYEFPVESPFLEDSSISHNDFVMAEDINTSEMMHETDESEGIENKWGFSISIFKKKFHSLFKIVSGIAATVIVVISIIVILLRRHKSGIKLHSKKIQIIY
jgi:hypothetical protein